MDAARWERIQALFHEAADLALEERHSFLAAACGDDVALLAAVERMLDADAADSVLDRNVSALAGEVVHPPSADGIPDHTFGPYRLVRPLGEGGMGVVYLARRDDLGSSAAIKILRDAWLSPARRERFTAEQRTLAGLNHPSIARLFDADTLDDGTPWFAMEFVDGVPITEYCAARSSTIDERLRLFCDVCGAVQHAHRHLVVHRDLKPSNILVTAEGRVKLLDFGISKQLETLDIPADQTRTVFRMMTPAYAAPEQLRGEPVGIHTDVYALGVVLYQLLAGRLPFDLTNRTPAEAEALIVDGEPPAPGLGTDLDVLCLTAMHKDLSRRYASVEALARDVSHYLEGEPLEARADTFRYRTGKFLRRRWRPLAAAVVMLAVVAGLASFYAIRLAAARAATIEEAARTQRVLRFTLNMLEGDEASGPSESLRVITLVERGVQQARALSADPLLQAEMYSTLGGIYQKLGNLDEADGLLRAALDERRARLGEDHPDVADSLVALGQLRGTQAAYDEAERLIREGLDKGRRRLGTEHPFVARATTALGEVLENRGSYADAAAVLEDAVRTLSLPGRDESDLAHALAELANTRFYLGEYDQSESLNRRVLAVERRLYGDRHPQVADTIVNLGAIEFERGRYAEAERFHREALEIIRAWHGAEHPRTASVLTMVARAVVQQNRLEEAAALLRESLRISERAYGLAHPRVASALNELGIVAQRRGRLDEAERLFERMVKVYREVYDDKHYYIAVGLSNLAGVHSERGRHAKAEALFREALSRYAETLTPDHQLIGIAHVRLGRAILAQRRYREAATDSLAGYEILMKQTNPPQRWVGYAREDLAAAYTAMHQPDKAAAFRGAK